MLRNHVRHKQLPVVDGKLGNYSQRAVLPGDEAATWSPLCWVCNVRYSWDTVRKHFRCRKCGECVSGDRGSGYKVTVEADC